MTETKTNNPTEKEIRDHVNNRVEGANRLMLNREASLSHAHTPTKGLIDEFDYGDLKTDEPSRLVCRIVNDFTLPPGITEVEMEYNPKLSSLATFLSKFLKFNEVELVQKAMAEYNEMVREDPQDVQDDKLITTICDHLEHSAKVLNQMKSSLEPFKNNQRQFGY